MGFAGTAPPLRVSLEDRADIQALATSGYAHLAHVAYMFFQVCDSRGGRVWLRGLHPHIARATSWRMENREQPKQKPQAAVNVALSWPGLRALGVSQSSLATFPREFRIGMAAAETCRRLGQTGRDAPENWELGGSGSSALDALVVIHATTSDELEAWVARIRDELARVNGEVIEHVELQQRGARPDPNREHFGFRDGMSQPQIRGIHQDGINAGEFILGHPNEHLLYPQSPAVADDEDPSRLLAASMTPPRSGRRTRNLGRNGTYLVYRKLGQDVAGFWNFLESESGRLTGHADPIFMVRLAAKMVGRWPNGIPLVLDDDASHSNSNEFGFRRDPEGLACPFGAHIRRANPRDHLRPAGGPESLSMTNKHRILRRGSVYGPPLFPGVALDRHDDFDSVAVVLGLKDDGESRGLHFLAVNANLRGQFEFIQQAWLDHPGFAGLSNNPDPFSGEASRRDGTAGMFVPEKPLPVRTAPLPAWVRLLGGGYFFLPGLTALRYLARSQDGDSI